ncbi:MULTISPECIES: replication endonuclease [unclassified Nitratiruptor]|uniref:replication endonuclease n=1 Tax=unclassified Nitratiruptor TaxID=2624044 RepID=UPI0019167130|nr:MULTISPECIES: replication endonuclease [unclassified Nitratiruptor]BCD60040.1 hypothetical protein NitYY0810_C0803 [Nitratiruptor sp. YY08-10]BCD63960.1 hypothetical protein NitYY0814_C0799 [Nitratiruptor sp. YY08-14]BCD64471.1 hypothetical protein NitYY0814_C1318 [Nitratiruptor sp. YY08-14]
MAYGITRDKRALAKEKIKNTKNFLSNALILINDEKIPLIEVVQNSFINTYRYIAEINHRVASIKEYAESRGLYPVFITLTLPSQFHPKRRIKLKTGQYRYVRNDNYLTEINGKENNPRLASKYLSKMFSRILRHRSYYKIPKKDRLYFRVIEPHKTGVPHTHALFYIPKENVNDFVRAFKNLYSDVEHSIETDIKNSTAYMMKYVLKTLDDLRQNEEKLTDLTYWYVYWGICRIYTSKTFPSLEVYRKLKGKFSLLELHELKNKGLLHVYIDNKTDKLCHITVDVIDDDGNVFEDVPIWYKKSFVKVQIGNKRYEKVPNKWIPQEKEEIIPIDTPMGRMYYKGNKVIKPKPIPKRMNDFELISYYSSLDPDDLHFSYAKFAVVHNEMVDRGLIEDDVIPLQYAIDLDNDIDFDEIVEEIPF